MDAKRASEIESQPTEWLWPGYLAVGNLAILDGDPDQGKSMLTLDLAARLSAGRAWPDGLAVETPAPVVLLCAEDPEKLVKARLRSLGADMERVFVWPRFERGGLPLLPSEVARVESDVKESGAKLVVIDPIIAFLDRSIQVVSDADVRRALYPLAALAQKYGCVILMVRHLNKRSGINALYRGGGSIGIIASCRLAWLAGRDPKTSDRYILAQAKNNFAPRQASLAYTLPKDGPRVEWQGSSTWSADDLSQRRRRRAARDRAKAFLLAFLAAGPRTAGEVWRAAVSESFSAHTLRIAKTELGIRSQIIPGKGKAMTYWLLDDQVLPAEISIHPEVDLRVQELRKEWGERTPLD